MTIQDLGSLGELIAAIATVATLIYLAIQIRNNTNFLKADAIRNSSDQFSNLALTIGTDANLSRAWLTILEGKADYRELPANERILVDIVCRAMFNTANKDFEQTELGVAAESYWFEVRDFLIARVFPSKTIEGWWYGEVIAANSYNTTFRQWATEEIQKVHGKPGALPRESHDS